MASYCLHKLHNLKNEFKKTSTSDLRASEKLCEFFLFLRSYNISPEKIQNGNNFYYSLNLWVNEKHKVK